MVSEILNLYNRDIWGAHTDEEGAKEETKESRKQEGRLHQVDLQDVGYWDQDIYRECSLQPHQDCHDRASLYHSE